MVIQALNETWDTFVVILILTSRVGTKPMAVSFTSIELRKVRLNVRGASYMKEVILFFLRAGACPKWRLGSLAGRKGGWGGSDRPLQNLGCQLRPIPSQRSHNCSFAVSKSHLLINVQPPALPFSCLFTLLNKATFFF